MTLLFAAALFVNALLLFLVQPMFAKLLLPQFGGSPAVWTTCMLFFQSALLAGYAYSHSLVKLRKPWQQAAVHLVVIALPILTLPIAVSTSLPTTGEPIASVLRLSVVSVGAPFFALATSAPLLQRWFAVGPPPRAGRSLFPVRGQQHRQLCLARPLPDGDRAVAGAVRRRRASGALDTAWRWC